MDMVANGSFPSSSRECAHTLPSIRNKAATHTSPQLCRGWNTPVHFYMENNQNVTAEVVERLHDKLGPEALTAADE